MASVASEPKDRSRLSLSVDHPPSSSPFPSPSSSFVPPPVPGTHEFAVPSPHTRGKILPNTKKDSEADDGDSAPRAAHNKSDLDESSTTPNLLVATAAMSVIDGSPTTPTPNGGPTPIERPPSRALTATPTEKDDATKPTAAATRLEPSTPTSPVTRDFRLSLRSHTPSSRHDSLMSNRPAPPSPDPRRVSAAMSISSLRSRSGRSSTSRPASTALSRTGSNRMSSRLSTQLMTPVAATMTTQPQPPSRKPRSSFLIKIRDFAFPPHDERHQGLGPDVPRPNRVRVLNRQQRTASLASSEGDDDGGDCDDDDNENDEDDNHWAGFRWGGLSWGPGTGPTAENGGGSATTGGGGGGYVPSPTDFARNFDSEESEDRGDVEGEGEEEEEGDGFAEEEGEDRFLLADEPLYPGLYRAVYPFVPECQSEMALEEDQLVRVVGRGGGVGWAVVVKPEEQGGGHALVPESYLEVVRLDEEEVEGEREPESR